MKKLFFVFLCFCLFLTGCSNTPQKEVIRFSTWGSASEMAVLEQVIADFETQNPNIKVEVLHIPQDYFKKLHLLFASKMEPDVMLINNHNIPVYKKFLSDLSDLAEEDMYFPKSLESVSSDGVLYAVPRDCSGLVVYYNKDIFNSCKTPYPKENWSIEDFISCAKRLTNDKHWGVSFEPSVYYAAPFMNYFGGGVFDGKNFVGETSFSKTGVMKYKSLAYKQNYAPTPNEVGSKTVAQLFLEGRLGMHISGRWLVPKYRNCARFDWDVINFPHYAAMNDSTGWAISNRTNHIESAQKLVLFLSDKKNIEKFTESGLIVPARKDVANSNIFLNGKPNRSDVFLKSVQKSEVTCVNPQYNKEVERLDEVYFKKR